MPAPALSTFVVSPESQEAVDKWREAQQKLIDAYENRNQRFDPTWLAIAQALGSPTRTGKFGEVLGNIAANLAPVQEAENKRAQELARMRMEMAQSDVQRASELSKQKMLGQMYKTDDSGQISVDPEMALKYAQATGDPAVYDKVMGYQRQAQMKQIGNQMFTEQSVTDDQGNTKTVTKFNPNAALQLAKISDNPVEAIGKYAEMIPKMRKAGMLSDLGGGDSSSPFDAIVLMADVLGPQGPAIKAQAQRLSQQYRQGLIDDEKANQLAQQMMTMANSSLDRQTAMQNQQVMNGLMYGLRQESQALAREKHEDRKKEAESRLTDEQKVTLNKFVVPIVNEGIKASNALMQVTQLRNQIENAPSGALKGAYAASVGRLFGTDDNTALRNLDSLSKSLITMIPRLPGAASNLDAQNLEKSIGKLSDVTLTNDQRRKIVTEIETGFKRLNDRADRVQQSWESTKKVPMSIFNEPVSEEKPAAPPKPASPSANPSGANLVWDPVSKTFK